MYQVWCPWCSPWTCKEIVLTFCELSFNPACPQYCYQPQPPKDHGGPTPVGAFGKRPIDFEPDCHQWISSVTWLQPYSTIVQRQFCAPRNPNGEHPPTDLAGACPGTRWEPNPFALLVTGLRSADPDTVLEPGSSPAQPWFCRWPHLQGHPAGTMLTHAHWLPAEK